MAKFLHNPKIEIALHVLFSVLQLCVLVLVIRQASDVLLPAYLGLFLLARRLSSTAASFGQLGASQTIIRYVSINSQDSSAKRIYFLSGIIIPSIYAITVLPVFYFYSEQLTNIIFSHGLADRDLAFWTAAFAISIILGFIVSAHLLSERRIIYANFIRIMAVGGAISASIFFLKDNGTPSSIISLSTKILSIILVSSCVIIIYKYRQYSTNKTHQWYDVLKSFFIYGSPRGVITGLDALTAVIGPFLLRDKPEQAGYLIIAYSLFSAIQSLITPVTEIVATAVARAMGRKDGELSTDVLTRIAIGVVLWYGVLVLSAILPWLAHVFQYWLGDTESVRHVVEYSQWVIIGLVPACFFVSLRGMVDIKYIKPYNIVTLSCAIGGFFLAYEALYRLADLQKPIAVACAMVVMETIKGAITMFLLGGNTRMRYYGLHKLMVLACIVFAVQYLVARDLTAVSLVAGVSIMLVLLGGAVLYRPPEFIRELRYYVMK